MINKKGVLVQKVTKRDIKRVFPTLIKCGVGITKGDIECMNELIGIVWYSRVGKDFRYSINPEEL